MAEKKYLVEKDKTQVYLQIPGMLGREARELLTGRKAIERALILRSSRDR
jgi:hypothetical protein